MRPTLRSAAVRLGPGLLALGLISDCVAQLEAPSVTQIRCASDADCPTTFVCRKNIGKCVSPRLLDGAGPTLMPGSARVVPMTAREGTAVTFSLSTRAPLGIDPSFELRDAAGGPALLPTLTRAVADGGHYAFVFTPTGSEPEGTYSVVAALTDAAGNTSPDVVVGTLRLDFTPPALAAAPVAAPENIAQGQQTLVSLRLSEHLRAPPRASLVSNGPTQTVADALLVQPIDEATAAYTFAFRADSFSEGSADLRLTATDDAGNTATLEQHGLLSLDFQAPRIARVGPLVIRQAANSKPLLVAPTVATLGSSVDVEIEFDEPLGADPALSIWAPVVLPCSLLGGDAGVYHFRCMLGPGPAYQDGAYSLSVQVRDGVGNTTSRPVVLTTPLIVDTTPPQPANVAGNGCVLYRRAPWGSASTGGLPRFTVEGSSCANVPEAAPLWLVIYDSADVANAGELARVQANPDGSFPPVALPQGNLLRVYVLTVDAAGNAADADLLKPGLQAGAVRDEVLTATLTNKQPGSTLANPHRVLTVADWASALAQGALVTTEPALAGTALAAADGNAVTVRADPVWESRPATASVAPPPRTHFSMVYDGARGRVVMFGGRDAYRVLGDTWEFDGREWLQVADSGPAPRADHAMAYDAARGQVVLFGGAAFQPGTQYADAWVWDGAHWAPVATAPTPPARRGHALAYDAARGRVMLFGGLIGGVEAQDTWTWDGRHWQDVSPSGLRPGQRQRHTMAYVDALALVLLYGGSGPGPTSDMWGWNGSAWLPVTLIGATPAVANFPAMTYDAVKNRLLLLGDLTYELNLLKTTPTTGQWLPADPAGETSARLCPQLVFDTRLGRAVVFGGVAFGSCDAPAVGNLVLDTLVHFANTWHNANKSPTQPQASDRHVAAYDAARAQAVVLGGKIVGTWTWNDLVWAQPALAAPVPPALTAPAYQRARHAMAYDAKARKTLFFGGLGAFAASAPVAARCDGIVGTARCGDTWQWGVFGTPTCLTQTEPCWQRLAPAPAPAARFAHAMAYDVGWNRTVLYGGECSSVAPLDCADTWIWDGASWGVAAYPPNNPAPQPPRLDRHAMAYDESRARTVMFGGRDSTSTCIGADPALPGVRTCSELWEFGLHGAGVCTTIANPCWRRITPAAGPAPIARSVHTLTYDSERRRVLLFGGQDADGNPLGDLWEWDGSAWTAITAGPIAPSARFSHAMYYDALNRRSVLIDGSVQLGDLWQLDVSPSRRPAVLASFDLRDEVAGGASLTGLGAIAIGQGRGYSTASVGVGVAQPGSVLWGPAVPLDIS